MIPLTFSENGEVCGNSAAALANLCSRVSSEHEDYILDNWTQPSEGIYGFLIRFLRSGSATFEHIALWTILQLLESNNHEIQSLIKENESILSGIKNLSESQQQGSIVPNGADLNEYEDPKVELFNLTQQILQILG